MLSVACRNVYDFAGQDVIGILNLRVAPFQASQTCVEFDSDMYNVSLGTMVYVVSERGVMVANVSVDTDGAALAEGAPFS